MLRITKRALDHFVWESRPCRSGWEHYAANWEEYFRILEGMKGGKGYLGKGEVRENLLWLFRRRSEHRYSTLPEIVRNFNDDFYDALERCRPLRDIEKLEIAVARLWVAQDSFEYSSEELAAIYAPRNAVSRYRAWNVFECVHHFKHSCSYAYQLDVSGEYMTMGQMRKMSVEAAKTTYVFVRSREDK